MITKLFRPATENGSTAMAQVYENHYDSSIPHINKLACVLKEDFPEIELSDIKIHKYGGQRVKGITFAEVQLGDAKKVPAGYSEVKDIEYIL